MTHDLIEHHVKTTYYARPKMSNLKPENPDHPQAKRRRRRNTTLMVLGILMAGGSTVAGGLGISNEVLVNGQWTGMLLAAAGAGLYTWTYLDRMKIGK